MDAAAQLPPQSNLKRFVVEGADLVAYSGGKALGGQASGFLCGRRDLVMAAALQHLDHDVFWDLWTPPEFLIDKQRLKGLPQHGIGRSSKVGKEEIMGLLAALRTFTSEGDAARHARWLKIANGVTAGCVGIAGMDVRIHDAENGEGVPIVVLELDRARHDASSVILELQNGKPAIYVDSCQREHNRILINPMCLSDGDPVFISGAIRKALI